MSDIPSGSAVVGAVFQGVRGIVRDPEYIRDAMRAGVSFDPVTRKDAEDTVAAFIAGGHGDHEVVDFWKWFAFSAPTLFVLTEDGEVWELDFQ